MRISNFKNFITERLGISEPSLVFAEAVFKEVYKTFVKFYKSNDTELKTRIEIDYQKLRKSLNTEQLSHWIDFPVMKFEIDTQFAKLKNKKFAKEYDISPERIDESWISVGGWASFFGNKNWRNYSKIVNPIKEINFKGAVINIGFIIDINENFNIDVESDKLKLISKLESTIDHELNHSFEHYIRTVKLTHLRPEKRSVGTAITWAGNQGSKEGNIWKFPKSIWNYWGQFSYWSYMSEWHEIRANVQEIGKIIQRNPKVDLESLDIYQDAEDLQKFDHQKFWDGLIEEIGKWEPYKGIEIDVANRLKDMWVKNYKKYCEEQDEKPIKPFVTLEKMDCKEFLKFWEKRINFAGERIKRKAMAQKYTFNL